MVRERSVRGREVEKRVGERRGGERRQTELYREEVREKGMKSLRKMEKERESIADGGRVERS